MRESTRLWIDAVGRDITEFEELKIRFLERYWGVERQSEVMRKFYTPGSYHQQNGTKEQYLLTASRENSYLDTPLNERSLVGAISRQLGAEIAKYASASNIVTVEALARMLSVWEEVDKEEFTRKGKNEGEGYNHGNNQGEYYKGWRNNPGRRMNYGGFRNVPEMDNGTREKGMTKGDSKDIVRERGREISQNRNSPGWRDQGRFNDRRGNLN